MDGCSMDGISAEVADRAASGSQWRTGEGFVMGESRQSDDVDGT